jgi:thioesterase-3
MGVESRMQKIFTYDVMIKEHHLDFFGHVNNAAYLALFEEARWELVTHNGYGIKQIQKLKIGPTILGVTLSFLREIFLREKVKIHTQLISYEKKIFKISQMIKRNDDLCCRAEFTMALFDMQNRKLISPTPEWLHAIGCE